MKESTQLVQIEARWPVALAILVLFSLLSLLPGHVRIFPAWVPYVLIVSLLVPMAALAMSSAKKWWLRIEIAVTLGCLLIGGFGMLDALKELLVAMVRGSREISGLTLLTSSVGIWATNVLLFSLMYWRLDRGGPEARIQTSPKPDWVFPREEGTAGTVPDCPPGFIDYLFLAFTTATAFGPTYALPLTSRAKMLMMLESIISLVTIIAVASRAINLLGS